METLICVIEQFNYGIIFLQAKVVKTGQLSALKIIKIEAGEDFNKRSPFWLIVSMTTSWGTLEATSGRSPCDYEWFSLCVFVTDYVKSID